MNPPKLTFRNSSIIPSKGNFDLRQPISGTSVWKTWGFIYQNRDRAEADNFISVIKQAGQAFGITIDDPIYYETKSLESKEWVGMLEKDFDENKNDLPEFILSFAPPIA